MLKFLNGRWSERAETPVASQWLGRSVRFKESDKETGFEDRRKSSR